MKVYIVCSQWSSYPFKILKVFDNIENAKDFIDNCRKTDIITKYTTVEHEVI